MGRYKDSTQPWFGNAYRWLNYCLNTEWYNNVRTIADRKYLTSKKLQIKLDDGAYVNTGFKRMKVACYLTWWYKEE